MRKRLIFIGVPLLVVLGIAAAFLTIIRTGPRKPAPDEDPVVRWNRENADITNNAAEAYLRAIDALTGAHQKTWCGKFGWQFGDPIPDEAIEWVETNAEARDAMHEAATKPDCWFEVESDTWGSLSSLIPKEQRNLQRLIAWEGRIAAANQDWRGVANAAKTLDAMSRHLMKSPGVIQFLSGLVPQSMAQQLLLMPYTWADLSDEDRAAYTTLVLPTTAPLPTIHHALDTEQEWILYMATHADPNDPDAVAIPQMAAFVDPERLAGEFDLGYARLRQLADLPPEKRSVENHPLLREMEAELTERASITNPAAMITKMLIPSLDRVFIMDCQILALQRGNRTAIELFATRDRTGEFPETLDAIDAEYRIDPFSGNPFVYRRTEDGFTLYSVGIDREDDGGAHSPAFGRSRKGQPPDGDYVFWPIPTRVE